jgi:hypothetical protein
VLSESERIEIEHFLVLEVRILRWQHNAQRPAAVYRTLRVRLSKQLRTKLRHLD